MLGETVFQQIARGVEYEGGVSSWMALFLVLSLIQLWIITHRLGELLAKISEHNLKLRAKINEQNDVLCDIRDLQATQATAMKNLATAAIRKTSGNPPVHHAPE